MESIFCACGCGQSFTPIDARGRPRKFVAGHHKRMPEFRAWKGKRLIAPSDPCACGCGQVPKYPGAKFCHGHHLRVQEYKRKITEHPDRICEHCEQPFQPKKRGTWKTARFCSRQCFIQFQLVGQIVEAKKAGLYRNCPECGKEFIVAESLVAQSPNSGVYCSLKCLRKRRTDLYRQGIGGAEQIRLQTLKDRGAKCESCGYDRIPAVLVVHHLKGKGTSGHSSNLRVLCPTCHAEHHVALGNRQLPPTFRRLPKGYNQASPP